MKQTVQEKLAEEKLFLIAAHAVDNDQSQLLGEVEQTSGQEELLERFDITEFVGKGFEICLCRELSRRGKSHQVDYRLRVDGVRKSFELVDLVISLPLIEGEVKAGVYNLGDYEFYQIRDALTFCKVLTETDGFFIENYGLVCGAEAVKFRSLESKKEFYTTKCHPFEFFDVFCPLCMTKVMGGESS